MKLWPPKHCVLYASAFAACVSISVPTIAADDEGRKACAKEARKLCPEEMKTFDRKKVEACMIRKFEKTSPKCQKAMLEIKAKREEQAREDGDG